MTFRHYQSLLGRLLATGQLAGDSSPASHWSIQLGRRRLNLLACPSPLSRTGQAAGIKLKLDNRPLSTQVPRPYVDPKLSYAFGKSQEHLIYSTISREFDAQLQARPNDVAFISHSERIKATYSQFNSDINKLAKAMVTRFGLRQGDFVGLFAYYCYNWLLIQYACTRIGAVLTPINPSYKADELAYILKRGKIRCLFLPGPKSIQSELNNHISVLKSSTISDLFATNSDQRPLLENVIFIDGENDYSKAELNGLELAKWCQFHDWSAIQSTDGQVFRSAREAEAAGIHLDDACILDPNLVSPDDLFAVYYTSGTTGKPKGACCTQFTVLNNVRMCQIRLRNGRPKNWRAVVATTLPLFHIFAGVLNALSPVVGNTAIVLASHKYDIKTYVESIIEHQANVTTLTPTMLIDLLTYAEQNNHHDLPLKSIQPGGALLPPELVTRSFKILSQLEEVRTGYGSTENGAVATYQTIHEPEAFKAYTVGPPIDFSEVRVVDPNNDGVLVPLGERGEVQTRGHNTMLEYLDLPAKTKEAITPNRWYRTGDIGIMHPHGSIQISGRLKHMIIKGGENIYPEEVEQMMHKIGCIEKVHVVGVPDKRFGEQVCAWVKLKPGFRSSGGDYVEELSSEEREYNPNKAACEISKDDILKFCKENMTYFKVPKYLFFVQEFPMTPTKKVQNHLMVKESVKILKLDEAQ
jgi:fatty-acyl-CoA synthase